MTADSRYKIANEIRRLCPGPCRLVLTELGLERIVAADDKVSFVSLEKFLELLFPYMLGWAGTGALQEGHLKFCLCASSPRPESVLETHYYFPYRFSDPEVLQRMSSIARRVHEYLLLHRADFGSLQASQQEGKITTYVFRKTPLASILCWLAFLRAVTIAHKLNGREAASLFCVVHIQPNGMAHQKAKMMDQALVQSVIAALFRDAPLAVRKQLYQSLDCDIHSYNSFALDKPFIPRWAPQLDLDALRKHLEAFQRLAVHPSITSSILT